MNTSKRLVTAAAAILLVVSTVCAQEQTPASSTRSTTTVTAAATSDRVRFTAPSTVVQMRLEIYGANGEKLFDNEIRGGNVIDWRLQDGQAERLLDGSYLCVITSKSLSGLMSQKLGKIAIENAAASVQPMDISQLTAQQSQAVGPLEEKASLTVLKEGENQTATVIAHNGEEGQITRGRGALSFRIGDFYRGKDTEQMRLTAEGNLGIGITHPQARLDVDGLIRASQGIIFPDGTTQYSAASKTLGARSTGPDQILGGKHKFQTEVAGTGTTGRLTKWTDGPSGTLGDSVIAESGGIALFGTTTPINSNHVVSILAQPPKTPLTLAGGSGSMEFWKDTAGLSGLPTKAAAFGMARPGLASTDDMVFSAWDGSSWSERMRMTNGGNVGIGTNNPAAKLDVAGEINTSTQYNIGGSRVLSIQGNSNTTVGLITGITGSNNSFFGAAAGSNNSAGVQNSYFGVSAGRENLSGVQNSFFGYDAGRFTTGSFNTFFGNGAGTVNTIGGNNTFIGYNSNPSSNGLNFATAIGAGAVVASSNTVTLGRNTDTVQIPGALSVTGASTFGTLGANIFNATTQYNIGGSRVLSTSGQNNLFAGVGAGQNNVGLNNAFVGGFAGLTNTTGNNNAFFGTGAGGSNTSGAANSFFGTNAGGFFETGSNNSFFGHSTGVNISNGSNNTIVGANADFSGGTGSNNTIVGANADLGNGFILNNATAIGFRTQVTQSDALVLGSINGVNNATADTNVGIGTTAPTEKLQVAGGNIRWSNSILQNSQGGSIELGGTNTIAGSGTPFIDFHFNGLAEDFNARIINDASGQLSVTSNLRVVALGSGGFSLCRDNNNVISNCSSSLRYKTNIKSFSSGLNFINRLRPIEFSWKDGGMKDVGFGAEDVEKISPLLVTYNSTGQVEGVKYDRLSVVFVNAFKEQQGQIKQQQEQLEHQQKQIDSLKQIVCATNPWADICK